MSKKQPDFTITILENPLFLEIWQPNRKGELITVAGALLIDQVGQLFVESSTNGVVTKVERYLKSPRIGKLFPENKKAQQCRFKSKPIECKQGEALKLYFQPEQGEKFALADIKRIEMYDANFYKNQQEGSLLSAKCYFDFLFDKFKPRSIVDFGCGVGTWIKQAHTMGVEKVFGLDGPWANKVDNFFDDNVVFQEADLNKPQAPIEKFDMAMSLEVAEHLKPESASEFVKSLCLASDVVMFGAAYIGQPGKDHINCQLHSYWAELFLEQAYEPFDLFRSHFWGSKDVEPWYQQNTFLYVNVDSCSYQQFINQGFKPIENIQVMNMVHPWLYSRYCKIQNV